MPNIIQKGKYPEENKITCPFCKCYFEYYYSEIQTDVSDPEMDDIFGGFGIHRWIRCPNCNDICTIESQFIEYDEFSLIKFIKNKFKRKNKRITKKENNNDGKN